MYGTVMTATLVGTADQVRSVAEEWAQKRDVPGFRREEVLVGDDGRSLVVAVFFDSKEDYQRLADDPEQDTWWSGQMSPLVSDVRWIDGSWQEPIAAG
jgi:heme-degrading monooxygenase HmoA